MESKNKMKNYDSEIIDTFKFIGEQASLLERFSQDSSVMRAPSYKLLKLIDNHPELREQFVECIKTFMGEPWVRTKPQPDNVGGAPDIICDFLMYILQWEELYNHVKYLFTTVDDIILHRELINYNSCFHDDWEDEDLFDDFDFEADRNTRKVDVTWKEKYKEFE